MDLHQLNMVCHLYPDEFYNFAQVLPEFQLAVRPVGTNHMDSGVP